MKRITMLPEKMPDEVKNMLTQFYGDVISELDNKSANEMLVSTFLMFLISQFGFQIFRMKSDWFHQPIRPDLT